MTKEEITLLTLVGWKQILFDPLRGGSCESCKTHRYRLISPRGVTWCPKDTLEEFLEITNKYK